MRVALAFVVLGFACTDLEQFEPGPDHIYQGTVAGIDEGECTGSVACSFIRRGFPEGASIELMGFDPERLATNPGSLRTSIEDECGGRALDGAELQNIVPLAHDQLALYDFPGGERLRNYMYMAETQSSQPDVYLSSRDVMVFLSLLRGGDIELRIVAGSGQGECGDCNEREAGECDYFGVFRLSKTEL